MSSGRINSSVFRFIAVGLVGLLIDAATTSILVTLYVIEPSWAKILGFGVAVLITYFLHHRFTFTEATRGLSRAQFVSYLLGQCVGAGINLVCFLGALSFLGQKNVYELLLAVAIASAIAAVFNYIFAARVVYVTKG